MPHADNSLPPHAYPHYHNTHRRTEDETEMLVDGAIVTRKKIIRADSCAIMIICVTHFEAWMSVSRKKMVLLLAKNIYC